MSVVLSKAMKDSVVVVLNHTKISCKILSSTVEEKEKAGFATGLALVKYGHVQD